MCEHELYTIEKFYSFCFWLRHLIMKQKTRFIMRTGNWMALPIAWSQAPNTTIYYIFIIFILLRLFYIYFTFLLISEFTNIFIGIQ